MEKTNLTFQSFRNISCQITCPRDWFIGVTPSLQRGLSFYSFFSLAFFYLSFLSLVFRRRLAWRG